MKRFIITLLLLAAASPLAAQLYHPGELLQYRVSYKAKMFPNTEVGTVEVTTTAEKGTHGEELYRVEGIGRTLPTYRWFFNMLDIYTVWIDAATMHPVRFEGDIREGDYTFQSVYTYDWANMQVNTRWRSRQKPYNEKQMPLTPQSLDAVSLFFSLRTAAPDAFAVGAPAELHMVLEDTIRFLRYRFLGREVKKIRNVGKFKTLKFECELGSTQGFTFSDGSIFSIWISDDENKIPLYIESPVRVGTISAYISGYRGLKYPVTSLIK